MSQKPSRRSFLKAAGAAAGAIGFPYVIGSGVLADSGKPGANDKINVGFIGVGGRGGGQLRSNKNCAAAVCDVDKNHLADAAKVAGEKAGAYTDYRYILERKDIDAVLISTPDHWHAQQTIHACEAGKDVYCEKPACNTIAEGQAMVHAAKYYNRVVQIGSQGRALHAAASACDYIRNGQLGKVSKIICWHYECPDGGSRDTEPVPAHLDWNMWLGPAAWRPYHKDRVHFNFRWFLDLGGGCIRDRGAHVFSLVSWFMNVDHTGPVSVEAKGSAPVKGAYDCPTKYEVTYQFKNPDWTLVWAQPGEKPPEYSGNHFGFKMWGDKDTLFFEGGDGAGSTEDKAVRWKVPHGGEKVFRSPGHVEDWMNCIRTRETPLMNISAAHHVAAICNLGNASYILGRKLNWDAEKEVVVGDEVANRLLNKPWRDWTKA